MSSHSVTEDEKQEALKVRKSALKSKGMPLYSGFGLELALIVLPDLDLATIARSSSAVSTSPPTTVPVLSDADVRDLALCTVASNTDSLADHQVNPELTRISNSK